jgi:nucleoside-diphosphate-sugar epimerase
MSDVVVVTGAAGALGGAVLTELRGQAWTVLALDLAGPRLDALGAQPGVYPVPA